MRCERCNRVASVKKVVSQIRPKNRRCKCVYLCESCLAETLGRDAAPRAAP